MRISSWLWSRGGTEGADQEPNGTRCCGARTAGLKRLELTTGKGKVSSCVRVDETIVKYSRVRRRRASDKTTVNINQLWTSESSMVLRKFTLPNQFGSKATWLTVIVSAIFNLINFTAAVNSVKSFIYLSSVAKCFVGLSLSARRSMTRC